MFDEQRRWRPPVQFYQRGESTREALKTLLAKSARRLQAASAPPAALIGRGASAGWMRRLVSARTPH